jgi:hypothetical protein
MESTSQLIRRTISCLLHVVSIPPNTLEVTQELKNIQKFLGF